MISEDDIRGSIQKELASKEYALKQLKKRPKGAAEPAATASVPSSSGAIAIDVDDDVWSVPSDTEPLVVQAGSSKATKKDTKDTAAVAARKAARTQAAAWKAEVSKATRTINSLNTVARSLKGMVEKVQKSSSLIDETLMESLNEADAKIKGYLQRSSS